jgi:hypothetical protein
VAVAVLLAACGGEASSDANEKAGTYTVDITEASFPLEQRLGQTSLLRLAIHNTGEKTLPATAVTISIVGKAGRTSTLPFAIHDPQTGLAQPDRPVWVLAQGYPRLAGSSTAGGASTSNRKTFSFGPLKPDGRLTAVWKVSAVKAGKFTLECQVAASLSGTAKTKTAVGIPPRSFFATDVTAALPDTEVTDSGEVVEKAKQRERGRPGE